MNSRRPLLTLGVGTLLFVSPLAAVLPSGCGNYESDPATGGAAGTGGTTGGTGGSTGGSAAGVGGSAAGVGGAGGSAAGTGGAGGSAAGTGGAAGSAQAGTGTAAGGMPSSGGMATSGTSGGAGEGGEVSCEAVAACGGDLVGTWTVVSCPLTVTGDANMMGFGLDCKSAPVMGTLEVTGTVSFMADGSYMDGTTTTGTSTLELPELCKHVSGTTTTCESLAGSLESLGYKSAVCPDNTTTGGCSCTAVTEQVGGLAFVSPDFDVSGQYKTADNKLVTTVFGIDTEYPYCVAGNTLTMTLGTVSKTGPVTGSIVLQK